MKKLVLFSVFALVFGIAHSTTVTIINSGFTFSPAEVTIDLGDTVVFQLGGTHNAVEVSESTWNANGNTALPGFSVGFGGGMVTGLTAGVHFYVCTPHAEGGMKGKITVNASSGIQPDQAFDRQFNLYPNPAKESIILDRKTNGSGSFNNQNQFANLEIYNSLGEQISVMRDFDMMTSLKLDLSGFPSGSYILRVNNDGRTFSRTFIKE